MFENGGDILRAQNLTTAANMTVASLLSSEIVNSLLVMHFF